MDFLDYIIGDALILIPVLIVIGAMTKRVPKLPDWLIPFELLFFGILGAIGLMGFGVNAVIQGILCAGAAVYGHQLYKQGTEALKTKPPDEA